MDDDNEDSDDNEENTYESKWTVNRRSLDLNQLHILNICNDDDDDDDVNYYVDD